MPGQNLKRKLVWIILPLGGIVFLLCRWNSHPSELKPASIENKKAPIAPVQPTQDRALGSIQQTAHQESDVLRQQLADRVKSLKEHEENLEKRHSKEVLAHFELAQKLETNLFNRDQVKDIYKTVLDTPEYFATVKHTLADLKFAKQQFGENQAMSRIFAVKTLMYAAEQGQTEATLELIQSIAAELNAAERITPGRAQDLEDLVAIYTRVHAEDITADLGSFLKAIHYTPVNKGPIRAGLWLALGNGPYAQKYVESMRAIVNQGEKV